jgi:hypothetical protein
MAAVDYDTMRKTEHFSEEFGLERNAQNNFI